MAQKTPYSMKNFLEVCLWVATKTRSTMSEMHWEKALAVVDPNVGGENALVIDVILKLQPQLERKELDKFGVMSFISLLNQYPLMASLYYLYMTMYPETTEKEQVPAELPSIMDFLRQEWSDLSDGTL